MKKLYVIYYECAHWWGTGNYVVVWAHGPKDACERAEQHMEEDMRELYSDEYDETYDEETCTNGYEDESAVNVISCDELTPEHESWQYYQDPSQAQFYPVIGEPE